MRVTRRTALHAGFAALATACTSAKEPSSTGRLRARPSGAGPPGTPGLHRLDLERPTLLYIPPSASAAGAPFALLLHAVPEALPVGSSSAFSP